MKKVTTGMGKLTLMFLVAGLASTQRLPAQHPSPEVVQFQTTDGVTIFGDLYRANAPLDAPVILFFHQGGSAGRPEYGPLVGRILAQGYHGLAIDQRLGGSMLGGENRTVAQLGSDQYNYCDAYPDLEAALAFIHERGFAGPRVLWGSSYSAALVVQLAARRPDDVAAVLAFSPASGDPMAGCEPMPYSGDVNAPLLVLRPSSEMDIERVRLQMESFRSDGHETYVANPGVHGSSLLNPQRVGAPTDQSWTVVLDFLRRSLHRN